MRKMETIETKYDETENAWRTGDIDVPALHKMYFDVHLAEKGLVAVRQQVGDEWPRVPVRQKKEAERWKFRIRTDGVAKKIELFTSKEPKKIEYAYI